MATIAPVFKFQFLDGNGNPLTAGKLYTYIAGTTTPLTTYTTAAGSTPNTNPIILDSAGRADIFLTAGSAYKFVLANAGNVTQYTVDNITAPGTMSTQNASAVTITGGTISGVTITGPITGDVTGNLTGNVTGNLTGNVTGGAIVGASYNGGQLAGLRNKIINGAMEVAQRGVLFSVASGSTGSGYTLDRYTRTASTPAVLNVAQGADAPASEPTLLYSLRCTVTTADAAIAAADLWSVLQKIEGYSARDLVGKTFTLSFWVRSAKTGVHCVTFQNDFTGSTDRSYVAEYNVLVANTWEYKQITVIGGLITAGTWDWTNGSGVNVGWTLCCGSSWQGASGSWQSSLLYGTSSQVNVLDTIGNVFAITGVQLEVGSIATPFEHRPFGMELALCQRYYEKSFPYNYEPVQNIVSLVGATDGVRGAVLATGQVVNQKFSSAVKFAVTKRTTPTITTYAPDSATANWSLNTTTPTAATANIGDGSFAVTGSTAVTAGNDYSIHWQAVAEL
jgi:hypothetical protein